MVLFYCLAKTDVNGEIIIQGKSVTYTASASALASANTSFKDSSQLATIDSNTEASKAARKAVDDILIEYAYVLSDANITSLINNSLKTTTKRIIPVLLKDIATNDGKNVWRLNKNTIITTDQFLHIKNGQKLIIDASIYIFENYGIVQIGENLATQGSSNMPKISPPSIVCDSTTNPCCAAGLCGSGGFVQVINSATLDSTQVPNKGDFSILSGSCWEIDCVNLLNSGVVTNSGCIALLGGSFSNTNNTGALKSTSTGRFYSNSQLSCS